jgi:Mce-associated membrane protein
MIALRINSRFLRTVGSRVLDPAPVLIVAVAAVASVSVLGHSGWAEAGCGLVIAAAAGLAGWTSLRRRRRGISGRLRVLSTAAPAILALAVLVSLQVLVQRPADRELAADRGDVAPAAADAVVAMMSYQPATVDKDLATAETRLTGDFRGAYTNLADTVVAPTAKQKGVTMRARAQGAAVESVSGQDASVIVYLDQITTVAGNSVPSQTQNVVRVGLTKVHGTWLVDRFDPLF